jgi:hypothetical protein
MSNVSEKCECRIPSVQESRGDKPPYVRLQAKCPVHGREATPALWKDIPDPEVGAREMHPAAWWGRERLHARLPLDVPVSLEQEVCDLVFSHGFGPVLGAVVRALAATANGETGDDMAPETAVLARQAQLGLLAFVATMDEVDADLHRGT